MRWRSEIEVLIPGIPPEHGEGKIIFAGVSSNPYYYGEIGCSGESFPTRNYELPVGSRMQPCYYRLKTRP